MEVEADAASESGDVLGDGANRGDEDVADLGDEDDPSGEDGVTLVLPLYLPKRLIPTLPPFLKSFSSAKSM